MLYSIKLQDVGKQAWADLVGKDSYRGVTFTYTWLANQFGHFSLGYLPTLALYSHIKNPLNTMEAALQAACWVSAFWAAFETFNFLGPLLFKKKPRSGILPVLGSKYTFKPDWWNVGFDTVTDVGFFTLGAFFAGWFCHDSPAIDRVIIILSICLSPAAVYWYLTKFYLQAAGYPYQQRLSQWENENISEADKGKALTFIDRCRSGSGNHLLIFGPNNCGKTGLAVGIGTELSIKHSSSFYTTAMKLLGQFCEPVSTTSDALWIWRDASLLVIDDINPGDPIQDLISVELFGTYLNRNKDNPLAIVEKNVVWILGMWSENSIKDYIDAWKTMLRALNVADTKILEIDLHPKKINTAP